MNFWIKSDKTPTNKQSGMYQINCADCDKMYIGQTKRNISIRAAEHMRNVKNIEIDKSAIASHVWNKNHRINKEPKLLKQLHRRKELNVWEKIFIYKNNNKILNFEIPGIKDLIQKFVRPPSEKCQIAMQQPEAPVGN